LLGDWVETSKGCDADLRLRVLSDRIEFVNGADREPFGQLDLCHSCEGGARYDGIVLWVAPGMDSEKDSKTLIRFNADERPGIAVVEMEQNPELQRRFPMHEKELRKCPRPNNSLERSR